MQLSGIGMLIPDWVLGWLAVAAVGAAIIGLPRRIVFGFAAPPLFRWIILPNIDPWFAAQPFWFRTSAVLIISLLGIQAAITLVFGKQVAGHFVGTMLVRLFDLLLLGPLRGIAALIRRLLVAP